jgi:hypothetical protein
MAPTNLCKHDAYGAIRPEFRFQDRRLQPLGHLSDALIIGRSGLYLPLHVISLIMTLLFRLHNTDCD